MPREDNLLNTLEDLQKAYGKGSVIQLSNTEVEAVDVFPSSSIVLNELLGVGGFPRGKIVEIYGQESSSKTTLAKNAAANCLSVGGRVLFIDFEHAFDRVYGEILGIPSDCPDFFLAQPSTLEEGMEALEKFVRNGVDMVIWDSTAAAVPQAELEADNQASVMGVKARQMSKLWRKTVGIINQQNVAVLVLNQLREKIGVLFGSPLGPLQVVMPLNLQHLLE